MDEYRVSYRRVRCLSARRSGRRRSSARTCERPGRIRPGFESRVPQGRLGDRGFHAPEPRRHRRRERRAREIMREIYRPLCLLETPIVFTSIRTAELVKYASNAFLAVEDIVHKRDRRALREDRRGRRRGGAGDGARPEDRPEVPARRRRLRRLVPSQGRFRDMHTATKGSFRLASYRAASDVNEH